MHDDKQTAPYSQGQRDHVRLAIGFEEVDEADRVSRRHSRSTALRNTDPYQRMQQRLRQAGLESEVQR